MLTVLTRPLDYLIKSMSWDQISPQILEQIACFLGACREHSHKVPLEFVSEKELEIFCNALDRGEIHAACEVSCSPRGWRNVKNRPTLAFFFQSPPPSITFPVEYVFSTYVFRNVFNNSLHK